MVEEEFRVEFRGRTREYFWIWLVNCVLTVVTLGLFSPWAKVRSRRYLYSSMRVGERAFGFDGDPKRILLARLGFVFYLLLFYFVGNFYLRGLLLALGLGVSPLILVWAWAVEARHSFLGDERFRFEVDVQLILLECFWVFLWTFFTLGLALFLWPFWWRRLRLKYLWLGGERFAFQGAVSDYLLRLAKTVGLWLGALLVIVAVGGTALPVDAFLKGDVLGTMRAIAVTLVGIYLSIVLSWIYFRFQFLDLFWSRTVLSERVVFQSSFSYLSLLWLYLRCGLAMVVTLGLAYPWARIQWWRYRAARIKVVRYPAQSIPA